MALNVFFSSFSLGEKWNEATRFIKRLDLLLFEEQKKERIRMGGGRDKRKKHDKKLGKVSQSKLSGMAKTERKTELNLHKKKSRSSKEEDEENDIERILRALKLKDEEKKEVRVEENCGRPEPGRASCTLTTSVAKNAAYLFGGECTSEEKKSEKEGTTKTTTTKTRVFNDMYKFVPPSSSSAAGGKRCGVPTWTKINSVNSPPPRSGHCACYAKGYVYVFGGEFTSPNQEKFKHYSDFWRFDCDSNAWEQLESGPKNGGPSARSGSRCVATKSDFILFGGFYDAAEEIRYFNDCYAFDFDAKKWRVLAKGGTGSSAPSARSACHVCVSAVGGSNSSGSKKRNSKSSKKGEKGEENDGEEKEERKEEGGEERTYLYVYGGYCKHVEEPDEDTDPRDLEDFGAMERAITREDCWKLDVYGNKKWQKVKKAGLAPRARAGASSVVHLAKKRLIVFGGVVDHEIKKGDVIVSEFLQDAFTFNYNTEKWFPLTLFAEKNEKVKTEEESREEARKIAAGELDGNENFNVRLSDREKAAVRIQATFRGHRVRKAMKLYRVGGVVSELLYSPGTGEEAPKPTAKPRGRINASVCVVGNDLWLYGGIVEVGDVEVVLDDVWKLDLSAKSKWIRSEKVSERVANQLSELEMDANQPQKENNNEQETDDDSDDDDKEEEE